VRSKLRPVTIVVYNGPVKLRSRTWSAAVVSWNGAAHLFLATRYGGAYSAT